MTTTNRATQEEAGHTPELLPCPFCGFRKVSLRCDGEGFYFATCSCGARSAANYGINAREVAASDWNTRAADPVRAELLEALQGVLATGLNGGNNYRLAMMAASRQVLDAETLEKAEASEQAVQKAFAAIAKAREDKQS